MMGGQSATYNDYYYQYPTKPSWDPKTTLRIINTDHMNALTCVGYAPSKRRRCHNPINKANRASAHEILEDLEQLSPQDATIRARLRRLAGYTLCLRYHQGQVDSVVDGWMRDIARLEKPTTPRANVKREPDDIDINQLWREMKGMSNEDVRDFLRKVVEMKRAERRGAEPRRFKREDGDEYEEERAEERRRERARRAEEARQEEARRAEEARREEARREEARREEARQQAERLERERVARERREKERQRREQEERKRKEEEERRRRETEERNERAHRRAENMRKEKERLAKDKAEADKKMIEQAWLRYVNGWDTLKDGVKAKPEELRQLIPWPVISSKVEDVNDKNVEEFFRKAAPYPDNACKMFQLMKMECLKWHTDRIPKAFGPMASTCLSDLFNTVMCIVIKLRSEVQEKRAR